MLSHQSDTLNLKKSILDELYDQAPHLPVSQVRAIAGAFLFTGDLVEKKCGVLSERRKSKSGTCKAFASTFEFSDLR